MSFIPPMLASPMKPGFTVSPGEWVAEEKFDGHRLIIEVSDTSNDLFTAGRGVWAWSRDHKSRVLPRHLRDELVYLPVGIYDGELMVPGGQSHNVTELEKLGQLQFVVFDVLESLGKSTTHLPYSERRQLLEASFDYARQLNPLLANVVLAESTPVASMGDVVKLRDEVWARGGEGLILKRVRSPYSAGKRTKDFVKVKQLRNSTLTVVGFEASRGTINNRGPYACVVLEDEDGNVTTVKTRNDACIAELEKVGAGLSPSRHPYIGRRLCIEYQNRTEDGGYRHPRWDRWEDE
jgi:bifunctional non-homologous end joining protein LigD